MIVDELSTVLLDVHSDITRVPDPQVIIPIVFGKSRGIHLVVKRELRTVVVADGSEPCVRKRRAEVTANDGIVWPRDQVCATHPQCT